MPILTRAGCNSGACHGALAGKGGLKLSLRGYDPDADHFVLTRQALGPPRRPQRARREPAAPEADAGRCRTAAARGSRSTPPTTASCSTGSPAGRPGPKDADADARAARGLPAGRAPEAEGHAAGGRPGRVLRRHGRGRDAAGPSSARSEELVADVDEDGQVTVAGHGEAAVTRPVRHPRRHAHRHLAVPEHGRRDGVRRGPAAQLHRRARPEEAASCCACRRRRPCTDAEFIRRAYLDACGILPTPEEVDGVPRRHGRRTSGRS